MYPKCSHNMPMSPHTQKTLVMCVYIKHNLTSSSHYFLHSIHNGYKFICQHN